MKSTKIGIFDYSAGNLGSLKSAFYRIGFDNVLVGVAVAVVVGCCCCWSLLCLLLWLCLLSLLL